MSFQNWIDGRKSNIEYKESWRDEFLKTICDFANADGGTFWIGISDDEKVMGVKDPAKLLEDIPNKIINHLSIIADVNAHLREGKTILQG